jgi:hypothetical protein
MDLGPKTKFLLWEVLPPALQEPWSMGKPKARSIG